MRLVKKESEADITKKALKKVQKDEAKRRLQFTHTLSTFMGSVSKVDVPRGAPLRMTMKVQSAKTKVDFAYEPGGARSPRVLSLSAVYVPPHAFVCACVYV